MDVTLLQDNPALSLGVALCTILIGITAYGIYVAFGPPSAELSDPFEDHEGLGLFCSCWGWAVRGSIATVRKRDRIDFANDRQR